MKRATIVVVFGATLCASCVDQGPGPQGKKIDPKYVTDHVLQSPPPTLERWDVKLGDAVVYIGNTVDKPRVTPGQPFTITHYWMVTKPITGTWKPFALLRGPANGEDFMNLVPTDMEIARPPSTWKPNEIIEDVQTFTLRPDWRAAGATLLVGLIEDGGHGTLDRMLAVGPHTKDRAVVARELEVDLSRAQRPGTIHIPRATAPIMIDGVPSDQPWGTAVSSPDFATGEGSGDPVGKATAKMTWDDNNLYVFVSVTDSDIVSPYKKHDDSLWQADCVELFIDADSNGSGYVELQVNPNNATFDSWFATTRAQPGDVSWDSGMITAVKLRGTSEPGDTDTGWDVEIAIPWQAVKGKNPQMTINTPPHVGDRWRLNVVRVDHKTGGKGPTVASWNRITISDFHALDRMLTAIFADSTGSIAPTNEPLPPVPGVTMGSGSGAALTPATSDAGAGSGSAVMQGSASQQGSAVQQGSASMAGSGSGSAAKPGAGSASPAAGSAGKTGFVAPPTPVEQQQGAAPVVTIDIDDTGTLKYAGSAITDADLDKVLRVIAARDKNARIVVRTTKGAPQQRVLATVEHVKRVGLTKFELSIVN